MADLLLAITAENYMSDVPRGDLFYVRIPGLSHKYKTNLKYADKIR